jgi:hypothetical protein
MKVIVKGLQKTYRVIYSEEAPNVYDYRSGNNLPMRKKPGEQLPSSMHSDAGDTDRESARFTSLPFRVRFEPFTLGWLFHVVDCVVFAFIMAWCSRQLVLRNGVVYWQHGFGQRFCIAATSRN